MKVVIMAGGKGTRISSIANDIPKPMIDLNGKPVLEYIIDSLKTQGFTDIILIIGHLGNVIKKYFKDGSEFGVKIEYFEETIPLGTAGALYKIYDDLSDDFFLLNGDVIMDVDFEKMRIFHQNNPNALATILVHPNSHPFDSALISCDRNNSVIGWSNKEDNRDIYKNLVNAGVHILNKHILDDKKDKEKIDLDRELLRPLVGSDRLFAYKSPEYIKDMGTPERYYAVLEDIKKGEPERRNIRNKQKAVFLDRDGTINIYKGFISDHNQIELIDGVAKAVREINKSGYLAIVITNQPVIARGECSFSELEMIHNKIETLLGNEGAYLDDIFFCPHHPDSGFEGERPEYKIECECRKPKPGLLLKAAERYNIDLSESFMVGDSKNDIIAGERAGCRPILLKNDNEINTTDVEFEYEEYINLLDFVNNRLLTHK